MFICSLEMSWPWSHSSDPSRRPILNPRLKAKTRGKRPQKRAVTSAPNRNQPFLSPSIQWTSLGILISSLWEKAHALDKLRNIQISSPIIQDFFFKRQIKIINRRRFRAVGLLLGLGFGPGCLAQAGAWDHTGRPGAAGIANLRDWQAKGPVFCLRRI